MANACDKCGLDVPADNDAARFDAILLDEPILILFGHPRHLLPVTTEDGATVCPGSPSRAQYLEGQPHDTRSAYAYDPSREEPYREAYTELMQQAASV